MRGLAPLMITTFGFVAILPTRFRNVGSDVIAEHQVERDAPVFGPVERRRGFGQGAAHIDNEAKLGGDL